MMIINYYEVLDIESNATEEQIKKAYRINAIKYHPDKNFGDTEFTKKFIEVKEAYDILIDDQKRRAYDLEYNRYFAKSTSSTFSDSTQNKKREQYDQQQKAEKQKEEEKFRYDPYKQFYSAYDRELQDTPQFYPIFGMWGEKLPKSIDFFSLPKRIGKIIFGISDLTIEEQPLTIKQKSIKKIIGFVIGLAIGVAIFFIAGLTNPFWIAIWFLVPIFLALQITKYKSYFIHNNYFIGVNGFALYTCFGKRENVTIKKEINFNEMTDLYVYHVEHSVNNSYQGTNFLYVCLNRNKGQILYENKGDFKRKDDIKKEGDLVNFCRNIERYWTIYLLDRLEQDLHDKGYITFCLYYHEKKVYHEYIKLGIGFLTFAKQEGQEFTYKFNEIKKMYCKGSELHIQHNNFKRTWFFNKSGNEDVIPMLDLCNRQFFYKAMEILLGYSIQ